jgi:two-component system, chemotaxis family, chemotaxis protein CheY
MRALVIDDSSAMRALLRRLLRDFGFEVSEAPDVSSALQALEPGRLPQLALVDWNLPGGSGIEFVRAVRIDAGRPDIRILMITTEVHPEQVRAALDAGAQEYLMKPFTREALQDKLALMGFSTAHKSAAQDREHHD